MFIPPTLTVNRQNTDSQQLAHHFSPKYLVVLNMGTLPAQYQPVSYPHQRQFALNVNELNSNDFHARFSKSEEKIYDGAHTIQLKPDNDLISHTSNENPSTNFNPFTCVPLTDTNMCARYVIPPR